MEIKVAINDSELKTMFANLRARLGNMTPVMDEIGQIVRRSILKNFEAGGRPARWQPNAASTILAGISKADFTQRGRLRTAAGRRLSGGKVLIDTGALKNSVDYTPSENRVEIGPAESIPYGRIHQLGGPAGRGRKVRIPARPYLMVQDEDWPEIKRAVSRYLTEAAI